jgi:hypothetical protein
MRGSRIQIPHFTFLVVKTGYLLTGLLTSLSGCLYVVFMLFFDEKQLQKKGKEY